MRSSKICSPIKEKFTHPATHDFVILAEVNHTLKTRVSSQIEPLRSYWCTNPHSFFMFFFCCCFFCSRSFEKKQKFLLFNRRVRSENSDSPRVAIFQESEKRLSDIPGAGNERYSGYKTFLNYSGTLQIRKISILVERERTHSAQSWLLVD